jgi:Helix-turn-helix.
MINVNLLKSKIMAAGYTQAKLASKAGLSINSLNAKVNGKQKFNTDEVEKLCKLLNINNPVEKCDIF